MDSPHTSELGAGVPQGTVAETPWNRLPNEGEIAAGLRVGRVEAWQALYDAYARRLWQAIARQMPGQSASVPDVVQESFLAAARAARQYDPARGSLWMWLSGIARQQVALHYRVHQRHDRMRGNGAATSEAGRRLVEWLGNRQPGPPEALAVAETAGLVRATLTEIPEDYEMLLSARYFDGLSVEELAAEGQTTVSALRSKLARARRAFREKFEDGRSDQ